MTFTLRLDEILGTQQAAAVLVNTLTVGIVEADMFPRDTALRWVCERVTDSDPVLLAAPGQVWVRRTDTDPDEVPAPRLVIRDRLADPPRVAVAELEPAAPPSVQDARTLIDAGLPVTELTLGLPGLGA
ncbi:hypothetical protein OG729_00650 [Streptomyces sp. NBC_00210]|uniref:hypothetical protein n=1 Tax=Streptomyces sp. NBC_00210 TaxID=2903636 RepID=UPI00324C7193